MKPILNPVISLVLVALLSACAGPSPTPTPTPAQPAPVAAAPQPAAPPVTVDGYPLHPVYVISFDAQGVARGDGGQVVTREHVIDLLARHALDRKTVIHLEVPKAITDRDQSIAAFSRAHQVAKIFELLGFESILVALAK